MGYGYDAEVPMEIDMPEKYYDDEDSCCARCTTGDWCALTTFVFFLTAFLGGAISWSSTVQHINYSKLPPAGGVDVPRGLEQYAVNENGQMRYIYAQPQYFLNRANVPQFRSVAKTWEKSALRYDIGTTVWYWVCLSGIVAATFLVSTSSCCATNCAIRASVWAGSLAMSLYFITSIIFSVLFQYDQVGFADGGGAAPVDNTAQGTSGVLYKAFGFIVPAYAKIMYGLDQAWNVS